MNHKIEKLRSEHDKNKARIAELQGRNRDLERQITDLENSDILSLVRSQNLTLDQLTALIRGMKTDPAATLRGATTKKEDEPHA